MGNTYLHHPWFAVEQTAQLVRADVGFLELLLDHDPSARLSRWVFLAEQFLNSSGLGGVPVRSRHPHELDEKLNRIRVIVPVRPWFERFNAVVVGKEPVELLALVLFA
jgi:hypothetical protein|tara:strand:+ start:505 stop:828 length:324 start_codon:yes stop_codon:yes gene_type:complete